MSRSCAGYIEHGPCSLGESSEYCDSCGNSCCSFHVKHCYLCGKFYCKNDLPENYKEGKCCYSCKKFYCSSHGKHCGTCGKFYCSSHGKHCGTCGKFYCSSHGKHYCDLCKMFYCSSHLPQNYLYGKDCSSCNQFFCFSHVKVCGSCGKFYCEPHSEGHQSFTGNENGLGTLIYCVKQKQNGKYEGQWSNAKENGCGVFTWPTGLQVMQRYVHGNLVSEHEYSEEAQASQLVKEKMEEWEKTKLIQEKHLNEETQKIRNELQKRRNELERDVTHKKQVMELEIQEKQQKLNQEYNKLKHDFEEEKRVMTKFKEDQQGQVKLNVGGKIYETTVSTITKYPSMLQSMFSGRYEIKKDSNGCIFIDGDGEVFGVILSFLRRGVLLNVVDKNALLAEAKFYGLEVIVSALNKES